MTVLDFLTQFHLPCSRERPPAPPSRSELRRWFQQQAVQINGRRVRWNDPIEFPVWQCLFFPHAPNSRVTFVDHPRRGHVVSSKTKDHSTAAITRELQVTGTAYSRRTL